MVKSLRLALAIVETTSIPLIILTALYILSGYQLLYPQVYFMPSARIIHIDLYLRLVFLILVYLHSLAGIIIICERRLSNKLFKNILEYTAIALLSILIAIPLALEIVYR
ncbi:MAG: hypothetical protein QW101_04785 [Ignisphaera sp.]|uniref:Succinate dehydrogenase n=1 Tax=Ignisphaera aggregans TaxID=334771 RepID=A0A7J3MZA5_9CREN